MNKLFHEIAKQNKLARLKDSDYETIANTIRRMEKKLVRQLEEEEHAKIFKTVKKKTKDL